MLKTAVLLVNLGTPNSYEGKDVYRYLNEFLTDRRVITLPYLKRNLLVRGIIVPFRYKESAKNYKQIWTDEGSPLDFYTKQAASLLQESLGEEYSVDYAMRYQTPSIEKTLETLLTHKIKKLIVIPLFPQYASSTAGSVIEKVMDTLKKKEVFPEIQMVSSFYDQPFFIDAFCDIARNSSYEDYDHILLSFHGLPQKHLIKADSCNHCLKVENCCQTIHEKNHLCYSAQCHATAQKIADELKLERGSYSLCFQSRLGKDPWLQPFTSDVIHDLAKQGRKKVLVMCPSFVCDCLETLQEIAIEYHEEFVQAGGEELHLMRGLNNHPMFIKALTQLCKNEKPLEVRA